MSVRHKLGVTDKYAEAGGEEPFTKMHCFL